MVRGLVLFLGQIKIFLHLCGKVFTVGFLIIWIISNDSYNPKNNHRRYFFVALILTGAFLLSDGVGLIHLNRGIGSLVVDLFMVGAPLSLILSLIALFSLGYARHKWYSLVSGIEVLILGLVHWIFYVSQI